MKQSVILFLTAFCFITITSCDDSQNNSNTDITNDTEDVSEANLSALKTYYVVASKGLRMRTAPSLDAEKLDVVAYGSEVLVSAQDEQPTLSVGGMTGKMVKVLYKDKEGYMFDGYLSSIPVPLEDQEMQDYIDVLKAKSLSAEFTYTMSNEEMSADEIVSIPAANFQEALLIGQRLDLLQISFDIPSKDAQQMEFQLNDNKNIAKRNDRNDSIGELVFEANEIKDGNENSMAASYYFFHIGFDEGDQGYEKATFSTAYEGGSWTCTLEKEGSNYVFTKSSTAD